jgi:GT2 family glycosyltransferase
VRLAVIIVHYFAGNWMTRAVRAVRDNLASSGLAGEIRVVDNGSTPGDRAILSGLGVELLAPGRNLGYAGGVNLGAEGANGDVLVFMNPDVEMFPGCLGALAGGLRGGAAAAGPRFFWDREKRLMLPPSDRHDRTSELVRRLASRGDRWARLARRQWRRHARRHWRAVRPLDSVSLSGALLAVRRDAWNRNGPFDDGFALYFEESDWLARLRRAGQRSAYVPAAEAAHAYNQSAQKEGAAAAWMNESAARFARRHYGAWFGPVAGRAGRASHRARHTEPPALPDGPPRVHLPGGPGRSALWIEVSPAPGGFPAAAEVVAPGADHWELPGEVWDNMAPGRYVLQIADEAGRELQRFTWRKPGNAST